VRNLRIALLGLLLHLFSASLFQASQSQSVSLRAPSALSIAALRGAGNGSTAFLRQEAGEEDSTAILPQAETQDTTITSPQGEPPGEAAAETSSEKSPGWAAMRSLLVPGWGQVYTGHRLKAVFVAAAQVSLFTLWQVEESASDRDHERYLETGEPAFLSESERHAARASDLLTWTIVATFLSVLDAYIDAHLYGFDDKVRIEGEDKAGISLRIY
jgi:hypothetical protein